MAKLTGVLLFVLWIANAHANDLLMPGQTAPLPVAGFELVNRIPGSSLRQLPEKLPVFKRKPRVFSPSGLKALLDQSSFAGTNISELLNPRANQNQEHSAARLSSRDGLDYFIVNPLEGRVILNNSAKRGDQIPSADAVPPLESVRERALRLTEMLGVPTTEIERKADGSIRVVARENDRIQRGIKFKASRSVTMSRSIAGFPMLSQDDDKIHLQLGVNGRLLKFDLKWSVIDPVRTNYVLSVSKVLDAIKQGNVAADVMNEYPPGGVARIEIKDIRVVYYLPASLPSQNVPTSSEIRPLASLHVIFKSKTGEKTEGGLIAPILDSR